MDGLKISELAGRVGVPTSTVRYYERVGLLPDPARSQSGYRVYDATAESRLLFISRAKRLGFSLEQISELVSIWDGATCAETKDRVVELVAEQRAGIAEQIADLEEFADQLEVLQHRLSDSPAPATCASDLSCCAPELTGAPVMMLSTRSTKPSGGAPEGNAVPIACTLSAAEQPARLAAFELLFTELVEERHSETTLRYRFSQRAEIEQTLGELSVQEQVCCSFATFNVRTGDELWWEIEAPDAPARAAIEAMLPSAGTDQLGDVR